jgi:hypothetical protein
MPVSLSGLERVFWVGNAWAGAGRRAAAVPDRCGAIDKSKFADFKPLSLDVIFHDCKIEDVAKRNFDAFAR